MKTLINNNYRIDWTQVGEAHSQDKPRITDIIHRMNWDYNYKSKQIAMMPALAIKEAIKELKIPKVSAISYNCHELAPYGFYGIEGNYKNARVQIFIVDEGTQIVPVCMFVWEN